MTGELQAVLVLLAAAAVIVLGVLAWRGRVSWAWVAAALGGLLTLLGLRRPTGQAALPAGAPVPPRPQPAGDTVQPVLDAADQQADEDRQAIRDAADDEDRQARLDRLADFNDGGRL